MRTKVLRVAAMFIEVLEWWEEIRRAEKRSLCTSLYQTPYKYAALSSVCALETPAQICVHVLRLLFKTIQRSGYAEFMPVSMRCMFEYVRDLDGFVSDKPKHV